MGNFVNKKIWLKASFKVVALFLIMGFLFSATLYADRKFARIKGRVLKFGIPLYEGAPPDNYIYEGLGHVRGEYKGTFFDSAVFIMSKSLENLADEAKDMGANAVIDIESHNERGVFVHEGEAVVFNELPKE